MRIGVVTFPGSLDDRDATRAVRLAGAEAVALWHADPWLHDVDAIVLPGGFGTMDELFEALVLEQTAKIRDFPIVLVGESYWGGLLDWIRERLLDEGMIAERDARLLMVTDDPEEVARAVCRARDVQEA